MKNQYGETVRVTRVPEGAVLATGDGEYWRATIRARSARHAKRLACLLQWSPYESGGDGLSFATLWYDRRSKRLTYSGGWDV